MAAGEIRRAIVGRIPDSLRNCVNKEYFSAGMDSRSRSSGSTTLYTKNLPKFNPYAILYFYSIRSQC